MSLFSFLKVAWSADIQTVTLSDTFERSKTIKSLKIFWQKTRLTLTLMKITELTFEGLVVGWSFGLFVVFSGVLNLVGQVVMVNVKLGLMVTVRSLRKLLKSGWNERPAHDGWWRHLTWGRELLCRLVLPSSSSPPPPTSQPLKTLQQSFSFITPCITYLNLSPPLALQKLKLCEDCCSSVVENSPAAFFFPSLWDMGGYVSLSPFLLLLRHLSQKRMWSKIWENAILWLGNAPPPLPPFIIISHLFFLFHTLCQITPSK